jgi:hypothetical protein
MNINLRIIQSIINIKMASDSCPVCLEHYTPKNEQLILECTHSIHRNCAKLFPNNMCPICRKESDAIKELIMTKLQIYTRIAEIGSDIIMSSESTDMNLMFSSIDEYYCKHLVVVNKIIDKNCPELINEVQHHNEMIENMLLCANESDINDPGFIDTLVDLIRNIVDRINFFKLQIEFGGVEYNNDSSDSEDESYSDSDEEPIAAVPEPEQEPELVNTDNAAVIPEPVADPEPEPTDSDSEPDSDPEKITTIAMQLF